MTEVSSPLRLDRSENPFGPPPGVRGAILRQAASLHLYPDPDCCELRRGLAELHEVDPDMVLIGNGADELILLSALALASPEAPVVTTEGTFPGYRLAASAGRLPTRLLPLDAYRLPVIALADAMRSGPCLGYLCNPHNPLGTALPRPDVSVLVEASAAGGGVLVADEAYADFAGDEFASALPHVLRGDPVIVLRSLSKSHGLAGLRIGYALGDPSLLDPIRRVREVVPYSVNGVAQAAALRALRAPRFLERTRREIARSRTDLQAALGRLDVFHVPSVTNFVLLRSPVREGALCPRLHREHDILVRDAAPLGFPDHVRVSVGTRSQTARFIAAMTEMMGACDGG